MKLSEFYQTIEVPTCYALINGIVVNNTFTCTDNPDIKFQCRTSSGKMIEVGNIVADTFKGEQYTRRENFAPDSKRNWQKFVSR